MFHYPNAELTRLFAEACGVTLMKAETSGEKKKELEEDLLMNLDIEGMSSKPSPQHTGSAFRPHM